MGKIELTGELKGWGEYIDRKKELKTEAYIKISGQYRRIEMSVLRDRYDFGGKNMIHKIMTPCKR